MASACDQGVCSRKAVMGYFCVFAIRNCIIFGWFHGRKFGVRVVNGLLVGRPYVFRLYRFLRGQVLHFEFLPKLLRFGIFNSACNCGTLISRALGVVCWLKISMPMVWKVLSGTCRV